MGRSGFVLVEAAYANTLIISSNCNNGPKEIVEDNQNGFLFKSNDKSDFLRIFESLEKIPEKDIYKKKLNAKKMSRNFSLFNHYLELKKNFDKCLKKKLVIFVPSIEDGGVEKNLFLITNYLSSKNINVNLITANQDKKKHFLQQVNFISPQSSFLIKKIDFIKHYFVFICYLIFF